MNKEKGSHPLEHTRRERRAFMFAAGTAIGSMLFPLRKGFSAVDRNLPNELYFSKNHEWVKGANANYRIGLTNHAQKKLGAVRDLDLPKIGTMFRINDTFGSVSSLEKFDLLMPISGKISRINEELRDNPGLINSDPNGRGWIVQIRLSNKRELQRLMKASSYAKFLKRRPELVFHGPEREGEYVVTRLCVNCKYTDCAAVCPVEAFHELPDRVYINPETCIACDACVPECPAEAIFETRLLPDEYKECIPLNALARKYPVITTAKTPLRTAACQGP